MRYRIINLLRETGLIGTANLLQNQYFKIKKLWFRSQGKSDLNAVYNKRFFHEINDLTEPSASNVVNVLISMFKPKSVIDIGCGTGIYLKYFKKHNVKVFGIDGSRYVLSTLQIDLKEILIWDLRTEFRPKKRYDLCICFEVAEHIETKFSRKLVQTLSRCSDTIVFTAAPPGQGGTDHINEQKRGFWIRLFREKGFLYDQESTNKLQQEFSKRKVLWYLPKNIFVFNKINLHHSS